MTPSVSRLEQKIRNVEQAIEELRREYEALASGQNADDRWRRLLTLVEGEGGRVSSADWARLGRQCGYDVRGLGGFFRGKEPSMTADGDDRVLTARGIAYLDQYGRLR